MVSTEEILTFDRNKVRARSGGLRINLADESARDRILARISAAISAAAGSAAVSAPRGLGQDVVPVLDTAPMEDVALAVLVDAVGLTKVHLGARSYRQARAQLTELAAGKSAGLPEPDRTVMTIARTAHRTLRQWKAQDLSAAGEIGPIPPNSQWAIENAAFMGNL